MSVTNTYRNPILPGFNPDPSICYVPGKGYFVSTSTFEYFPGLPIYHSTDLVNWKVRMLVPPILVVIDADVLTR
jgi:beta-xylosidase